MKVKYISKTILCTRCDGTGLEVLEGRKTDCLMCNGRGKRKVTLPANEWKEDKREQPQQF